MRMMAAPQLALVVSIVLFSGCTERNIDNHDGAAGLDRVSPPSDGSVGREGAPVREGGGPLVDRALPRKDICVRPPGSCFSKDDCPAGNECKGCGADPCCPMCDVCLGKCTPVTGCASNAGCGGKELCNLDFKCTASGQCQPLPSGCPKNIAWVCGCDGKTYANDCVAHAAGVSVAAAGECCADLNKQYMDLVQAAKKCCALCATVDTCTKIVNSQLACPCPTVVNAIAPELPALQMLAAQWTVQGCKAQACPAVMCPAVTGGSCQPATGTPGLCADKSTP